MRNKNIGILFLFIFYLGLTTQAQIDREFWFVAPEVTSDHADRPIYLRFATFVDTTNITISLPASAWFTPLKFKVAPQTALQVDLTAYIDSLENRPENKVLKRGIYITASSKVSCYYEVLGGGSNSVNTDLFTLKGKNALGLHFILPFQNKWANKSGYKNYKAISGADIVATENNTRIEVIPKIAIEGHALGIPFVIILNKGETYSLIANGLAGSNHFGGTEITSNKAIAITLKDDSVLGEGGGNYDLAGDQIVPISLVGQEYVIQKGELVAEAFFITATENNTDIFLDGSSLPDRTLQKGEVVEIPLSNAVAYVLASKPIYIWHITGFNKELGGAILPSIRCTGSRQVSFVRAINTDKFKMNLLVKAGGESHFKINGNASVIDPSEFQFVPGTNQQWKYAQFSFGTNIIKPEIGYIVSNDSADFHLGLIMGNIKTARYGYFSDFASLDLGISRTICQGDSVVLDAGADKGNYLWNTGDTTSSIIVKNTGWFGVKVNKGNCIFEDSVFVRINKINLNFAAKDSACNNIGYTLKADTSYFKYLWQDGSKNQTLKPQNSGLYWLEVTNEQGCTQRDSIVLKLFQAPNFMLAGRKDTSLLCKSDSLALSLDKNYSQWKWQSGDSIHKTIYAKSQGLYSVAVIDSNKCRFSDSLWVTLVDKPNVQLAITDTLCPQGTLTKTVHISSKDISILWTDGNTDSIRTFRLPQTYRVTYTENKNQCKTKDSVVLKSFPIVPLDLSQLGTICSGIPKLYAFDSTKISTMTWNGIPLPNPSFISNSGLYFIETTTKKGCVQKDTLNIAQGINPDFTFGINDTTICEGEEIELHGPLFMQKYSWSQDTTLGAMVHISQSGIYTLTITNTQGCKSSQTIRIDVKSCKPPLKLPNVITPNGDGINDFFVIESLPKGIWSLSIRNRWGREVYKNSNYSGQFNAADLPDGTYYYLLESGDKNFKGSLQILR